METQKLFMATAVVLLGVVAVVALLPVMSGQVAMASPGVTFDAAVVADTYVDAKNPTDNYGGENDLLTNPKDNNERYSLLRFDLTSLPACAEVLTATLNLYESKDKDQTVTIREITASWDESVATWANFASAFDSETSYGSFDASTTGWKQVDIVSLVQRWAYGTPNYGLLLHPSDQDGDAKYDSRDKGGGNSAFIHIEYDPGVIAVYPDHTQQASPGDVVPYDHRITNCGAATDCVTVTAASSQGWSVQLWEDLNGNGVRDLGEPDLSTPVCIDPGATYDLGAEVSVPSGATDCTDETVITATSGNDPAESGSATDTTQVRVIHVDGRLDSSYSYLKHFPKGEGSGNEVLAPGNLYGYKGADTCYWAFVVDRAFNDNVYAEKGWDDPYMLEDGWTVEHSFGKLKGSDHAIFDVTYTGGSYTDLGLDYLNGEPGNWASGQTGKDRSADPGTPPISAAMTSLHWNLENSGWDGGTWGDPLYHSPPYDYNQTSGEYWEWHMIYEFSIPRSEMNGECGDVDQAGAHNSPNKNEEDENLGEIGDLVWRDTDGDGNQDGGEVGLPNVTVNLYQDGIKVGSTQTEPGVSGRYIFVNLEAGTYRVDVDESTLPSGYVLTSDNEPMTVTIAAGQEFTGADFGYRAPTTGESTYKITATATSADGSSTTIVSYVESTIGSNLPIFENAITSDTDIFINKFSTVNGDIHANRDITLEQDSWVNGRASAVGTISGEGYAEERLPGSDPLEFPIIDLQPYKDDASSNYHSGDYYIPQWSGSESNPLHLGPLYVAGNLTIDKFNYIVMESTVYVEGYIYVDQDNDVTITGRAKVIAEGNITMDKFNTGDDELTLIMSATGNIEIDKFEEVRAAIYAPKGIVYVNKFNDLTGAIVANLVNVDKFCTITYDPELASWDGLPGYTPGVLKVKTYNIDP